MDEPDERLDARLRAFEWFASEYGWSAPYIRETLSHELFYVYMHAAEGRIARSAEVRFHDAVEAVHIGYLVARDKKVLRAWERWRGKGSKRQVGLTGEALERAMAGILVMHPEFRKGVPRPKHLQPHALMGKQSRKGVA